MWLLVGVLAVTAVMVVASMRPGDPALYPAKPGDAVVSLYLIDNGFHTDLAAPRSAVLAAGGATAAASQRLVGKDWLAIGWGDAGFYTATGFSAARVFDAVRALFAPGNPSVIHLYGIDRRPDLAFGPKVATPIVLSQAGFLRLLARVDRSFALGAEGPLLARPPLADEGFFRSNEHFSVLKVCNHWTGEVLNAAGVPIIGALDLTSAGLLLDLRLRAGVRPMPRVESDLP